jgi:hypothetical protein
MAPATSAAVASFRSRRLRVALLLAVLLIPAAAAASSDTSAPVYIWRDANGVVRFSAPQPPAR